MSEDALTPVAVQNFVPIFFSKVVARSRCSFSHRPSEAMYASNVAAGKSMSAIFPTGPAVESKRCLANATLRSTPASGWGTLPDLTAGICREAEEEIVGKRSGGVVLGKHELAEHACQQCSLPLERLRALYQHRAPPPPPSRRISPPLHQPP